MIALLPDLAIIRDRTTGWVNKVYSVMCLGWRGTPRQWKLQGVAGILLSALVLPVFVSVHSIVSWDFAVQIGVEGWHSTIFAPYFIIGAIHSGVAAVATVMVLMIWGFQVAQLPGPRPPRRDWKAADRSCRHLVLLLLP